MIEKSAPPQAPQLPGARPHRSKTVAGALALFAGWAGAHRLYLGSRFWWLYPLFALPSLGLALSVGGDAWYRHPGFFVAGLVTFIAMFEAILICLTPDAKWDGRRNAESAVTSSSGWLVVLIAIAALMLGATLMMSVMAIALEAYFESIRTSRM
jgi:TM2 domain-containing membrane protein YozV